MKKQRAAHSGNNTILNENGLFEVSVSFIHAPKIAMVSISNINPIDSNGVIIYFGVKLLLKTI